MLLGATIRLKDQFTATMSKAAKQTTTLSKEANKTTGTVSKLVAKMKVLGKTVIRPVIKLKDQATSTLNKIKNNLLSLRGLAAGAFAAMGVGAAGEATIGAAMSREQQMITMSTLLGGEQKAKEFLDWGTKEAAKVGKTTAEMMQTMTGLAPFAKDLPTMQKYVQMAEVLAAINPAEGMAGATFSLKEALSGDFVSLQERFNLPRSTINALKEGATTSEDFFNVVQKAAESQGFTYELVEKQGKSAAGLWAKTKGQISEAFVATGEGILEGLKPQLQWLADFMEQKGPAISTRMQTAGQVIGNAVATARDVINTVKPVIMPIFEYIKAQIPVLQSMWETAWPTISSVLQTAWSIIQPALSIIGNTLKIVWGIFKAAWPSIMKVVETAWKVLKPIFEALGKGLDLISKGVKWVAEKFDAHPSEVKVASKTIKSHAAGIHYVPYDNYPALLHRGEAVLPRRDADLYRAGAGGVTVAKLADMIIVREEADIDRIVKALERKLRLATANRGRVVTV